MTDLAARLFDTHAHLDDEQFAGDVDAVIQRARSADIERIVNVGYRPARWRTTLALAARYPGISYSLGLHPHHADEWSPHVESDLISLLTTGQPVALGEIGLDYFRNLTPPVRQQAVFRRQLEIALDFRLPVIIHQRAAEHDLLAILKDVPAELVCILHSFDGTADLASFAVSRGHYIGAGGLMTRAASEGLRQVLRDVPVDRVLLETDSPYLVPAGAKGRRNEPGNLVIIARALADLWQVEVDDVARRTTTNANRAFGLLLSATTTKESAGFT